MSTDIKHQVMAELLDIHPAALEKAEEQASRIIEMVKGEGTLVPVAGETWFCRKETLDKLNKRFPSEPDEDFSASVKVQPAEFTTEDLSHLKDRGHTWAEIGAEAGISQDAARKRVEKWRAKQPKATKTPIGILHEKDDGKYELIEPGAEEARQEAEAAEATIRKSQTVEEFIQERIASGDMDYEILQAVKRKLPGVSMTVADIRSRR